MRNAFIQELVVQARSRSNIALVVGDLGYSVVEPFAEEFPDRFVNAGVAEQNMMGLAAGMASEGYHVFVYSIANFPTFRCAEQIRNDVDHHKLAVTIVSVGGGVAYGALGYSHHAIQDYGLMRLFPNMLIAAPADPAEVIACLAVILDRPSPSYLRLAKTGSPHCHSAALTLTPGKWVLVRTGDPRRTLLTTGATLASAMAWVKDEGSHYFDYTIHSLPLWGMAYKQQQGSQLSSWEKVVTVEDHLQDGGFCSWLMESEKISACNNTYLHGLYLDSRVFESVCSTEKLWLNAGLHD